MLNNSEEFRAYLTHLTAEHREFNGRLRRIEGEWMHGTDQGLPQVLHDLQRLRDDLAHHFQKEEEGGFLEAAVSHRPSLGPDADRLEQEHPELLGMIDRLIAKLQGSQPLLRRPADLEQEFRHIVAQLHRHEAAENRVLMESFDIGLE